MDRYVQFHDLSWQSTSELSPRMSSSREVHTGAATHFFTQQASTFARPVVPDCNGNHFWLLSAFSNCSDSHFRLLLTFSDCSVFFFIALAVVFDCSAVFSQLLSTFLNCSVPFLVAEQVILYANTPKFNYIHDVCVDVR